MIGSLCGIVDSIAGQVVTVMAHGVGYEVICSQRLLEQMVLGDESRFVVFTDVGQDHIRLYGFLDQVEKQTFLLLTKVKGVGPRSAADIVSRIECRELLRTIAAGDVMRLQSVKGIGKKTAERIVVELKDKVGEYALEQHVPLIHRVESEVVPFEEAIQALQALGFIRKDAERAVQEAVQGGLGHAAETGLIVKEALRFV